MSRVGANFAALVILQCAIEASAAAQPAGFVEWVINGRARVVVVVADHPTGVVFEAAAALQRYVHDMSGALLSIGTASQFQREGPEAPAIFAGPSDSLRTSVEATGRNRNLASPEQVYSQVTQQRACEHLRPPATLSDIPSIRARVADQQAMWDSVCAVLQKLRGNQAPDKRVVCLDGERRNHHRRRITTGLVLWMHGVPQETPVLVRVGSAPARRGEEGEEFDLDETVRFTTTRPATAPPSERRP
jgi:hypothetical protein